MGLQFLLQDAQILPRVLNRAQFFRRTGLREHLKSGVDRLFGKLKALGKLLIVHFQERGVVQIDPRLLIRRLHGSFLGRQCNRVKYSAPETEQQT